MAEKKASKLQTFVSLGVPIISLAIAALAFLISSMFARQNYDLEKRLKSVEVSGYLESEYYAVDMFNFCQPRLEGRDEVYDLNVGFIRNDIWRDAVGRTNRYCRQLVARLDSAMNGRSTPEIPGQNVSEYSLVYLEITNSNARVALPATLKYWTKSTNPQLPIWEYPQTLDRFELGSAESLELGAVPVNRPVRFPIAIIRNFRSDWRAVLIPQSLSWVNPLTEQATTRPTNFLLGEGSWRMRSRGVTTSGGFQP